MTPAQAEEGRRHRFVGDLVLRGLPGIRVFDEMTVREAIRCSRTWRSRLALWLRVALDDLDPKGREDVLLPQDRWRR